MKATLVLLALLTAVLVTPGLLLAESVGPMAAITAPHPGITVTSDTVDVGVEYGAADGLEVTRVALLVDGVQVGEADFDPPRTTGMAYFPWRTEEYQDGHHELTARVVDSEGRVGTHTISVLLQRGTLNLDDALYISSPQPGATVAGVTEVKVAGDREGQVKYVIFLVDNVFKALTNVRPFTYRWDTSQYLNGLHRLQARAYRNDGTHYLTPVVEVRVDNPSGATTLRRPEPAPAARVTPKPVVQLPARAETPSLPPPMHSEARAPELQTVEVAEPEVARPGTAPFVGPSGDLITPSAAEVTGRSGAVAPLEIAALPPAAEKVETSTPRTKTAALSAKAEQSPPAPELAGAGLMVESMPEPAAVAVDSLPAPAAKPASVASAASPVEPIAADATPVEVAALPGSGAASPTTSTAPAPPAPKAVAAEHVEEAVVTQMPEGTVRVPHPVVHYAMLPPRTSASAPAPKVVAEPASDAAGYVVQEGDCLWEIAAKYGVSARELAEVNGIEDPNLIHPGQRLQVPIVRLYADGKPIATDVPVTVADGRTIAPFRSVVESLGGQVTWDAAGRRAVGSALGRTIAVTIGSEVAQVDDSEMTMDAAAQLQDNRTVVPLRFLGDALKLSLNYEPGAVHIARAK